MRADGCSGIALVQIDYGRLATVRAARVSARILAITPCSEARRMLNAVAGSLCGAELSIP